jgi:hypothetical protein
VRIDVLVGDVNRDGRVNATDLAEVLARQASNTVNRCGGARGYTAFHDVNANGRIDAKDVLIVRSNLSKSLPAVPQAVASAPVVDSLRRLAARPSVTRELFSTTPVLATA